MSCNTCILLQILHLFPIILRLHELQQEKDQVGDEVKETKMHEGFEMLIGTFGKEELYNEPVVKLQSIVDKNIGVSKIIFFPGIEGTAATMEPLAQNLHGQVFCMQYGGMEYGSTIPEIVKRVYDVSIFFITFLSA